MGAPSNLPGFEGLVDQVAERAIIPREPNEPLDQFLGRCARTGVDVQALARQLLDRPDSRPNSLHRELLGLFTAPERVRLVTTNFDRHFATSAAELFGLRAVDTYVAPALPLGRNAAGIIHVHGALDALRHPLVLTDADFGRAYLTEGWATRFLLDLFLHNTVLFVGYSHGDPTMRYLARSLVPGTARFAVTPQGKEGTWTELDITPVSYPLRQDPDPHGTLPQAVQAWTARAAMGALDHEHRARELVTGRPPLEQEAIDYLRSSLLDPITRRFFLRHARGPAWLRFAAEVGSLDELFGEIEAASDGSGPLAQWLVDHFMLQHPHELLALFRAKGMRLGPVLWQALSWRLAFGEPPPTPDMLARWVTVLVATRNPLWPTQFLSQVLRRCTPAALGAALLLFGHLIEPVASFRELWPGLEDSDKAKVAPIYLGISPAGDDDAIQKAWAALLLPELQRCHHTVAALVTGSITRAHLLLVGSGEGTEAWDPLSFGRSAVEKHPQDRYPSDMDVVIDCARDLLEFLLREQPGDARTLIASWEHASPRLLRRLAIHGRAEDPGLVPEEALQYVVAEGLLYDPTLKHEVLRLIARAYAGVDEGARTTFLELALAAPVLEEPARDAAAERTVAYERYNLLIWLHQAVPDSIVTAERLAEAQRANPNFIAREHPDLTSWSSGVYSVQPVSPRPPSALQEKSPKEQLDWLLSFEGGGRDLGAPDREGLLSAVRATIEASFDWGWDLAQALLERGGQDRGLWAAILGAWSSLSLTADQWTQVIPLLHSHPTIESAADRGVADLLEHALKDDSAAPAETWPLILDVAERLVARPDLQDGVVLKDENDWLLLALNHSAGRAAISWLQALSRTRVAAGETWKGLSDEQRARLERVLGSAGTSAERARTIIASQAHFLFSIDPDWSRSFVVPLFNWSPDSTRAEQAWEAYLQWGRWNDALFAQMLPFYEQTYSRLTTALAGYADLFADRLASVAIYGAADPWHGGWLTRFIAETDPTNRTKWAERLGRFLRDLPVEAAERSWRRWLADYWSDRLKGVPRALSDGEGRAMVEWVFGLVTVAFEVMDLIERTPAGFEANSLIFIELDQSGLAIGNPAAAARLLRHVLASMRQLAWSCESVDALVRGLVATDAEKAVLRDVCESMARLGCPSAGELRSLVG
ncbi:MAG: DUF4020 domain-containing protein [Gemmatimonadales bacterium]